MQGGILLIAASGLLQQPMARSIPDTIPTPPLAYYARLGPAPRLVAPVELPRRSFAIPDVDSTQGQRPKAREYSNGYYTRLSIHKYASYATLPLFAAEYFVGQKLFNDTLNTRRGLKGVHSALALGIGGLFAVNTVTGVWNLWEGRKEPAGRARRYVHALLMLVSDAGFLATAASAPGDDRRSGSGSDDASHHRTLAIVSFSTATVGYLMMLIWK
jgi:hypothetical protein